MEGNARRKGLRLLSAFLLTLAMTSGLFAYTYLVDTTTIVTAAASADFADVSENTSFDADYNLLGAVNGKIGSGIMFDVTGDNNYTGDVEILVSLANADDMVDEYRFWMTRIELTDAATTTMVDKEGITKVISLQNPSTSFVVDSDNITGKTAYVFLAGGSYKTFPHIQLGGNHDDPLFFCEVIQASTYQ